MNWTWLLLIWLTIMSIISSVVYAFYLTNKEKREETTKKRMWRKAYFAEKKENKRLKKLIEKMKNTWRKNRYKRN